MTWIRNITNGLMFLNTWCPVGGTIWEGYRTLKMLTLEGGCMSVGKAFRFCNPKAFHVLFLCFFCVGEIWSFCFLIPGWSHCATHMASFMLNYIPWNYKLKEALFSSKLLLITVFYYNNIKITNIPDSLKQWDVANIMEMSNNIFWNQTCFKNINDTHHGFTLIKVEAVLFIGLLNCENVILVVV